MRLPRRAQPQAPLTPADAEHADAEHAGREADSAQAAYHVDPAELAVPTVGEIPPTRQAAATPTWRLDESAEGSGPGYGGWPHPEESVWSRPPDEGAPYPGGWAPAAVTQAPYPGDGSPPADWGAPPAEVGGPPAGAGMPPDGPQAVGAQGAPTPRRRRRGVRAVVALLVVLVLLIAGDRAAVAVAEGQMAKQIKVAVLEGLDCGVPAPTVRDVTIGGFPFLTQILSGTFKDIGVTIEGIPTPGPRISWVQARLNGIHVPLGDMISGNVGEVPVDDIRATVRLDYSDLNTYLAGLPGEIQVNPVDGGRRIEISGRVDIPLLGAQEVGGVTTFEVRNNVLTLVPSEVALRGAINFSIPIPGGSLLPALPIPVGQLPLDLNIVEASSGPDGLSLTARAYDVVMPAAEKSEPRQCP
ncbi:LmeA family phospholipid-binding protein [Parafrankia sp. EUN1f]|uniref:LmeA family phospholipid-binding protein n=1 Tax=Parafrankia sp. EUN1f TaxID=102897 RepID=UPI0012F9967B|nr:LmeA family phospholipid-binding protein [Parafrankia sp. EUN1f]